MNSTLSLSFRMETMFLTLLAWLTMYFIVNRLPVNADQRLDLGITFDRKIPFLPQFAPVYFSTYLFVIQPFLFLKDEKLFYIMLVSFATISFSATLVHALVPSKIERIERQNTENLSGWMLDIFQKTCKPHGNFPSMHVGLSVPVVVINLLTGGIFAGSISLIWAVLIALSTLYTKQHYILDVFAGLAGGSAIFVLIFWGFSNAL
jgi:membrane-associated phospholipid phosphatase